MLPNIKKFVKPPESSGATGEIPARPRGANWRIAVILLLAVCFFIGTASYNYFGQENNFIKWSSPDETANYYFSKLYAETGELSFFEGLNLSVDGIIHPRSMRSDYGITKPSSFLGIILIFGMIAKLTSVKVLPYLTPFFGAIGIVFFYLFIKKLFGRKNAFLSAFLLASFPPFIYYSARSMFHNVLFVVLFIVGLYFIVSMIKIPPTPFIKGGATNWRGWLCAALAGAFIGLAIITRTSELIWILPMLFVLWIFNVKKIGAIKLIIFFSFLFVSLTPMFYWNKILYGSFLSTGYANTVQTTINEAASGAGSMQETAVADNPYYQEISTKLKNAVSLFGFNPKQSLKMLYYYWTKMFPWLFWGAFLGFLIYLRRVIPPLGKGGQGGVWWKYAQTVYLISYFIVSLILIFYYGSWEIHDNPDPNSFTIGNSYTRYWLPVYLGAMPLVSMLILKITKYTPFSKGGKGDLFFKSVARVIIILAIIFFSLQFVLTGSEEGLAQSLNKHKEAKYQYDKVLNLTEENSVIITQYHDKLFFPERKVIVGLFDDQEMNGRYAKLVNYAPVYYYNFTFPQRDMDYLNNIRLKKAGLEIREVGKITDNFSLYKLSPNQ